MASMGRSGSVSPQMLPLAPLAPFGAMAPVKQTNDVYGKLAANWHVKPGGNYLKTFLDKYNDMYGKLSAGAGGVGGAGLGQFDPGNTGIGQFSVQSYMSPLLDSMKARIAQEYNDPKTSLGYLNAMDQMAAQEQGAQQSLANRFAGNQRGSGNFEAAQEALARDLMRNKSIASRETEMAAREMANKNAFGLEGMTMGQFNTEQGAAQAAYEAARQGQLSNAGMRGTAFENARQREQNAAELAARMNLEGNSQLSGMLNPLANMLQWDASRGPAAQAQQWNNLKDLFGFKEGQLAKDKLYATDLYNAQKQNYEQGDVFNRQQQKWQQGMNSWRGNPMAGGWGGATGGWGRGGGRAV